MASGSATGNPRNKVALKPGHSLMDWIRLGNSGKDLTGVNGVFTNVSKSELAEHNSVEDAWLSIRGIVYNVTHYMDFHPGGCKELMRGAGTDATNLFNQVHSWVNYESILKKCVVGRLGTPGDEDLFSVPASPKNSFSFLRISSDREPFKSVKMNWCQQLTFTNLIFNTSVPDPQVQVVLMKPDVLHCKINGEVQIFNLEAEIYWPILVSVEENGKVQLRLMKKKPELWKNFGTLAEKNNDFIYTNFWPGKILRTEKVTHDSFLIVLKYDNNVYNYINPGYHIMVKKNIDDIEARPYTSVPSPPLAKLPPPGEFRKSDEEINLLVKVYKGGFMSSWITSQPGKSLFISNPTGTFKTTLLSNMDVIYLFAGGTGITPMVGVISCVLKATSDKKLKLFYFNKSLKDIIWKKELEDLAKPFSKQFSITHILSQPDSDWKGRTGHIDLDFVKSVLPVCVGNKSLNVFVCICGRPSFAENVERFLKQDLKYTPENYFNFNGN